MKRISASVISVLVVYVGSYAVLLKPDTFYFTIQRSTFTPSMPFGRVPECRTGGTGAKRLFQPIVWLDQWLRPGYCSGEEPIGAMSGAEAVQKTNQTKTSGGFGFSGSYPQPQ